MLKFDMFRKSSNLSRFIRQTLKSKIVNHSFTKKTLDSWACMEWLYFRVVHRGYNKTVPTPARHQDYNSRDFNSTPVLQLFSLSRHMLSVF